MTLLKAYESSLQKIAVEFFESSYNLFETPQPHSTKAVQEICSETIIRTLMHIGVRQNLAIEALEKLC